MSGSTLPSAGFIVEKNEEDVTQQVRNFYDQIGWHVSGEEGFYQNARYEDLRAVVSDYIHACHLRVNLHLNQSGKYLLDAGSGPIQYPEYVKYSIGYKHRVCLDLSIVALQEARNRIGNHGLYVVADVSHLPFKQNVFEGIVSLHTFHHLPNQSHLQAYQELYKVAMPGCSIVVVNGWDNPLLTRIFESPMQFRRKLRTTYHSIMSWFSDRTSFRDIPKATYVRKNTAYQLKRDLPADMTFEIFVWRSVSVRFLRSYIHEHLGGRPILRLLLYLEDSFPHFFGKHGQYPLIVIHK